MLISNKGYESAQNYYFALRKNFINSCIQKNNDFDKKFEEHMLILENKAGSEFAKTNKGLKKISKTMGKVMKKIAENSYLEAQQILNNIEKNSKKDINPEQIILSLIQQELQKPEYKIENKIRKIIKESGKTHIDALQNLYFSYISRQTYNLINNINKIYEVNKASMAGYYHEQSEADWAQQLAKRTGIKAEAIGGKNTSIDIVLGKSNIKKSDLTKTALKDLDKMIKAIEAFSGEYKSNTGISSEHWENLIKQQKIKTAGIQSKLYTINFDNPRVQGYGIGNNKKLYDTFINYSKRLNDNKKVIVSQLLSAQFFGETNTNIIKAFGENNIIFRTGSQRFFIDDLIKELRKKQMALAFNYNIGTKNLTYYVILQKESALSEDLFTTN